MQTFSVTKMDPELVSPSEPTPSGCLPLCENDRKYSPGVFIEIYLMYGHGEDPVTVIKKGIADALVPYYPVAGRLVVDSNDGKLQVSCTGEGVWFVEASAECRLEKLSYLLSQHRSIPREQLLPTPPPEVDQNQQSFMMQVTKFNCGGFMVGLRYNRNMFDVLGGGQFIVAISEMARGLPEPKIKPIWCREAIPSRAQLPLAAPPSMPPPLPSFKFEFCVLDVSLDAINQMKNNFVKETGQGCTVFDIICAKLWQSRTRAINLQPDEEITFFFPVSVRDLMPKELFSKGGFYGNCVHFTTIKTTSGQVANGSLAEIVRLFKDAKARLPGEFESYMKGEQESNPLGVKNTYGAMGITYFRRLGYYEPDFGWGTPDAVLPTVNHVPDFVAGCTVLNAPAPKAGINLLTHCVTEEHLEAFREEIKKWG